MTGIDALLSGPQDERTLAIVRREAAVLCGVLRMHLDFEEASLLPLLDRHSGWGQERALRMRSEHSDQRETATDLEHLCEHGTAAAFMESLKDFETQLRADVAEEERFVLSNVTELPLS